MLETPHVIIGAVIAAKIGNPYLAIPIAFTSHFVLDKIPHWNPHFYTETQKLGKPSKESTTLAITDSLFALGVGIFLASTFLPDYKRALVVVICCFAAVLSDQIKLPYFFLKQRKGFFKKWTDLERSIQVDVPIIPGIATQILVSLTALWWFFV